MNMSIRWRPWWCRDKLTALVLVTLCCLYSRGSIANEDTDQTNEINGWSTVSYNAEPIPISIGSGKESILNFPWRVSLALDDSMIDSLRVVPIGDSLYFTPLMPFTEKRFYAENPETGAIMILDITASPNAPPRKLRFVDNRREMAVSDLPPDDVDQPVANSSNTSDEHSYAVLARFAIQQAYSPSERIFTPDGVSEHELSSPVAVNDMIPGHNVLATPLMEWRTRSGLYITQLGIHNRSDIEVTLDPRYIRHSVRTAASAFYSTILLPKGHPSDRSIMVIISPLSWAQSINQEGIDVTNLQASNNGTGGRGVRENGTQR